MHLKLIFICSLIQHKKIRKMKSLCLLTVLLLYERVRFSSKTLPGSKIYLTACSSTVNGSTHWSAYLFNDQTLTFSVNSIPIRLLYVAGLAVSSQQLKKQMMSVCLHSPLLVSNENSEIAWFQMNSTSNKEPYHDSLAVIRPISSSLIDKKCIKSLSFN